MNENGTIGASPALDVKVPGPDAALEVDALRGQPRRRPGLQPAPPKPERLQRLAKPARRPARPAARRRCCSGPMWIRPFRNVPVVTTSARQPNSRAVLERAARRRARRRRRSSAAAPTIHAMPGSRVQRRAHPLPVRLLVGLRPRRPDRRPAAPVEHLELDPGRVDRQAHQAAERVDLADEVALGRPANRRIAGHVRHGFPRQRAEPHAAAQAAPPPTPPRSRRVRHRRR